jgi:hypothetical protein
MRFSFGAADGHGKTMGDDLSSQSAAFTAVSAKCKMQISNCKME